jgi:hypothetical protein
VSGACSVGQLVVPDHLGSPTSGRGVDFEGWLTWECDSWSRAEHVAFEAIDSCIVWLT